jgi:Tol biopolymer transport system component
MLLDLKHEAGMPSLSPDGQRIALRVVGATQDIWVYELARGALRRLTFDDTEDWSPIWTPDGARITYTCAPPRSQPQACWRAADGSSPPEALTRGGTYFPGAWLPDGRALVLTRDEDKGTDLHLLTLGPRTIAPLTETASSEFGGAVSPDGKWLAFVSDESGRREVYIGPIRGAGRHLISTDGGHSPLWARNGRELFYQSGRKMFAVSIAATPALSAGPPRLLFESNHDLFVNPDAPRGYDVSPDGRYFVVTRSEPAATTPPISVITHWLASVGGPAAR